MSGTTDVSQFGTTEAPQFNFHMTDRSQVEEGDIFLFRNDKAGHCHFYRVTKKMKHYCNLVMTRKVVLDESHNLRIIVPSWPSAGASCLRKLIRRDDRGFVYFNIRDRGHSRTYNARIYHYHGGPVQEFGE